MAHATTGQETRIEGSIPADIEVKNNQRFLFISNDQRTMTHGIHKYPAKFFPELPRWIIERYTVEGDLVLDPFMGSGTANLEAALLGRDSIGVDVDPFSRFLASVKTKPLSAKELVKAHKALIASMESFDIDKVINGIPDFPYRDNWFKPYVLKELSYIKASIDTLDSSKHIKNFFLICFSSVIRAVSEADNNCTRTVIRKKLNKHVKENQAITLFQKRAKFCVEGMLDYIAAGASGKVQIPSKADARNLIGVENNSVDLAVTSPPYMNAVDYPRTHQLELYWLGLAEGSLSELKKSHVGTEVVKAEKYKELHLTKSESANEVIKRIYETDPRRAFIASNYIDDMIKNMREVHRVLKDGKRYVIVVGNNLVRGAQFETWRYLQEVAPSLGYEVELCFVSAIINHFIKVPRAERIDDDHVLVLKKCG